MEFFLKRPSVRAAQFDGSTESINNVLRLVDTSDGAPVYTVSNERGAPSLTVQRELEGPLNMMCDDWYVLEREQYGTVGRVMVDSEFRRMYEPGRSKHNGDPVAAPASVVSDPAKELQAVQIRSAALQAALQTSSSEGYQAVTTAAECFKIFLTGSNPAPAVTGDVAHHPV